MNENNVLIVGGTFDTEGGKSSSLVRKIYSKLSENMFVNKVVLYNGGKFSDLLSALKETPQYDIVFWFANVPNDLEKVRDVKSIAPKVMLVTSKRNDDHKYSDGDLVQRALASKSNLMFEFSKQEETGLFNIRIIDPLACLWYNGTDVDQAVDASMNRLLDLKEFTRQGTIRNDEDFEEYEINKKLMTAKDDQFLALVHHFSHKIQTLLPEVKVKRFVGNCSTRKSLPDTLNFMESTRCSKTFPSTRKRDTIYLSRRNVSKDLIEMDDFVPVHWKVVENEICYYGENKPSVDTPIQVRLYHSLPNINYMIHTHCYIKDAVFTEKPVPCGGIEEVQEIKRVIDATYGDRRCNSYAINLIGHGSIVMGNSIIDFSGYYDRLVERPFLENTDNKQI